MTPTTQDDNNESYMYIYTYTYKSWIKYRTCLLWYIVFYYNIFNLVIIFKYIIIVYTQSTRMYTNKYWDSLFKLNLILVILYN